MRRALALWALLFVIEVTVGLAASLLLGHLNFRVDVLAVALLAPAVQVTLLLIFVPALRSPAAVTARRALLRPPVQRAAAVLLLVCAGIGMLAVTRAVPRDAFDVARAIVLLLATAGFARARERVATATCALTALSTGHFVTIATRVVFPSQPIVFRWLVFFVPLSIAVLLLLLYVVHTLRDRSAAALLEWTLAPLAILAGIVIVGFYERPFLTASWSLLAHELGLAAAGIAMLAGMAAPARRT